MGNNYKNEKLVQNAKSFRMILETAKGLRYSQGFYGRLYNNIIEDITYNKEGLAYYLNNTELPKFKDTLDVVMYLEG